MLREKEQHHGGAGQGSPLLPGAAEIREIEKEAPSLFPQSGSICWGEGLKALLFCRTCHRGVGGREKESPELLPQSENSTGQEEGA